MKRKLFINLVTIALFSIFTASVAAQTFGFVYQGKLQYGGAVGIGFWETTVCGEDAKSIAKAIRYAANLIGVDHIALGSDFDGAVKVPFDTSGKVLITFQFICNFPTIFPLYFLPVIRKTNGVAKKFGRVANKKTTRLFLFKTAKTLLAK